MGDIGQVLEPVVQCYLALVFLLNAIVVCVNATLFQRQLRLVLGTLVLDFLEIETINWTELKTKVIMTSIFEKKFYTI